MISLWKCTFRPIVRIGFVNGGGLVPFEVPSGAGRRLPRLINALGGSRSALQCTLHGTEHRVVLIESFSNTRNAKTL